MPTQNTPATARHTPGPWAVMPCPQHAGKHPFHDSRWIATADAAIEHGHDPRSWGLESGSLICEMRDGDIAANARLIAAAPDLLGLLKDAEFQLGRLDGDNLVAYARTFSALARAAIQRATA